MTEDRREQAAISDCTRRLESLEEAFNELRGTVISQSSRRDDQLTGLDSLIATERERANGYSFRITALEGVKPLGINTLLTTAAAVLGVMVVIGGSYLALGDRLMSAQLDTLGAKIVGLDKDVANNTRADQVLGVETRELDREAVRQLSSVQQRLSASEAKTKENADRLTEIDLHGSRRQPRQ